MTISEAVQLVLQAAALGGGGETFVLDMGEPVKIVDLAKDLIRLSGLEEGKDIEIVFTGLRPGEKMFEEVFLDGEQYGRTPHEKIFIARNGGPPVGATDARLLELVVAAEDGDRERAQHLLSALVPGVARMPASPPIVLPLAPAASIAPIARAAEAGRGHRGRVTPA